MTQAKSDTAARKAMSPYRRHNKVPYKYPNTPLHKANEGVPVTQKTLASFAARIGTPKAAKPHENTKRSLL